MSSLYQIEKLNSENYETWKMQMKMILIHSELWDYANSIRIKPETEVESSEWEKNDQKALATIVLSLSPSEIIHVKRCKTSAEAWKLLNEVHQPKGPATKVFLTKQLILLKMKPNERMQDYLNKFSSLADKLSEMDAQVPEDFLSILLLCSLPESYEGFRTAIETRDKLPNFETLKVKMLEEAIRQTELDGTTDSEEKVFLGNSERKPFSSTSKPKPKGFPFSCHFCGKKGHKAADCRKRKSRNPKNEMVASFGTKYLSKLGANEWCLDSGATAHMCSSRDSFDHFEETAPVKITLAIGGFIEALGKGKVKLECSGKNGPVTLSLGDVLFVPELNGNLFSISRCTGKYNIVNFKFRKAEIVNLHTKICIQANERNGLYILSQINCPKALATREICIAGEKNYEKWHSRFGHLNLQDLKKLKMQNIVYGLPNFDVKNFTCELVRPWAKYRILQRTQPPSSPGRRQFGSSPKQKLNYTVLYRRRSESQKFRTLLRSSATKNIREIEAELEKESPSRETIRIKFEVLETNENQLRDVNSQIMTLMLEDETITPHDLEKEQDMVVQYKENFIKTKLRVAEYLQLKENEHQGRSNLDPTGSAQEGVSSYKLPKMALPVYDGTCLEWLGWWSRFKMIHESAVLSEVEKFQYLVQSMKAGTRADRLVRSYPLIPENYPKVVKALKDRFGDSNILTEVYVRQLLKLVINNVRRKNLSLEGMYDQLESHLRSLESLGVTVRQNACFLYPMVESSLPEDLLRIWQRSALAGYGGDELELPITIDQRLERLLEFLRREVKGEQRLEYMREGFGESSQRRNYGQHIARMHAAQITEAKGRAIPLCLRCKGKHWIQDCAGWRSMTVTERRDEIKKFNACFRCLRVGHVIATCRTQFRCSHCKGFHHTALHLPRRVSMEDRDQRERQNTEEPQVSPGEQEIALSGMHVRTAIPTALLATARVRLVGPRGVGVTVRALLDQGSQSSFVHRDLLHHLTIPVHKVNAQIFGINDTKGEHVKQMVSCSVASLTESGWTMPIRALVVGRMTGILPSRDLRIPVPSSWKTLPLADPQFETSGRVDVILGADVYGSLLLPEVKYDEKTQLCAQKTRLGWIVSGKLPGEGEVGPHRVYNIRVNYEENLDNVLRRFWEVEEVPLRPAKSDADEFCEELYKTKVQRTASGRYIVPLPFDPRVPVPELFGESVAICVRRQLALERRLARDAPLREEYCSFMKNYVELGHMTPLSESSAIDTEGCCFIPQHAVRGNQPDKSKLRVVFDASTKTSNGWSLNDRLYTGPKLQTDILTILMNWRRHKVVMVTDIEKMYRQIMVRPQDAKRQKIMWRESPDDRLKPYQLNTVTYGTSPAPFLALQTLLQLARDDERKYPRAAEVIRTDTYVDDILTGAENSVDALSLQQELIGLLKGGGFCLKKWASNDPVILGQIPEESQLKKIMFENVEVVKTLGLGWNPGEDCFIYDLQDHHTTEGITKRQMLSFVARLYDPIGWLSPVVIIGKILIQQLWVTGVKWDESLDGSIRDSWRKFRDELKYFRTLRIPRWLGTGGNQELQLHGFSDASGDAYAAAIYLRVANKDGIRVGLLAAKTRLAPIHRVSIPRLELCAAVLLTRLVVHVVSVLKLDIKEIVCWTDATIILSWIRMLSRTLPTFVGNRTAEIQACRHIKEWRHVPSVDNPADIASRGMMGSQLSGSTMWWNGPPWLTSSAELWPKMPKLLEKQDETKVLSVNLNDEKPMLVTIGERCSSLTTYIRRVAWIFRFINNCRDRSRRVHTYLTTAELRQAHDKILLAVQLYCFDEDLKNLHNQNIVRKTSKIVALNSFLDERSIIRVGGRIRWAPEISYDQRHPALLPSTGELSQLIIRDAHSRTLHGGVHLVLATLRQKYWILKAKNQIKKCIRNCLICCRYNRVTQHQLMSDLPKERLTPGKPFTVSGVDYAGPFKVKLSKGRGQRIEKGYICLFVCLVTRAIHVELVTDASTPTFLAAFKRFVARRGHCAQMYSDQGTNFVGAAKQLRTGFYMARDQMSEIAEILANDGTEWKFNPPGAPHFGGLWEAGIKCFKYHFRRIIGETLLTYEEFLTLIVQIEACLNSRPLGPISGDPNDLAVLTPAHFLLTSSSCCVPEEDLLSVQLLPRWKMVQKMVQHLWRQWSTDYIHNLQQRHKWRTPRPNVATGSLVLVREEHVPPAKWIMGRVVEIHPGKDGLVRVVSIRTKAGLLKRPLLVRPWAKYRILQRTQPPSSPGRRQFGSSPKQKLNYTVLYRRRSEKESFTREREPLELIHTDICGPMRTKSLGGALYFSTFIDDFSGFIFTFIMKSRSEVFKGFRIFKNYAEKQTGKRLKCIRNDNAPEYLSKEFKDYLEGEGIGRQLSVEYTPQQNGVAERANRTLLDMTRCFMIEGDLPETLWAELIHTSTYIRNRCPKLNDCKTPHELFTKRKPVVSHLKSIGSKSFAVNNRPNRSKFAPRSEEYKLIGYFTESKAYRLWKPGTRTIIKSRDVRFIEPELSKIRNEVVEIDVGSERASFKEIPLVEERGSTSEIDPKAEIESQSDLEVSEVLNEPSESGVIISRRGRGRPRYIRTGKPGRPRKEYPTANLSTQELLEAKYLPDPKDAEEALSGRDSYFWKKAMEEEFDSLIENKTWELVDPPKNRNIIGTKWVFKTKCNSDGSVERHKARLVAKGYSQQYGIDYEETFAPVVRQSTIRMFLALAVEYNLILHQMDVQSAYLNGEIKEEIFMTQPENFVSRKYPEKVCRLKKAIYGLKQAGIVWHEKLDNELKNLGLKQLQSDNCVYIKHDEGILLVAIYVDDLIIAAEREDTLKSFKESMKRIFKIKDLGGINCCLGIRIQMKEDGSISIDQERYIEELLAKYRMKEAKPISIPMDSNSKLTKISSIEGENEPVKKVEYQSLIGSLIYLSVSTRPDIAYAVSALGQFSNDPRRQHWNAAKRVLRYLKGTSCLRITYRKSNEALHGYADADWGGNLVNRKSHTGIVYFLARGPIAWESKKQQTVTLSSTESEYIALCEAGKEAVYLRALLDEMGFGELLNGPTVLKTDNQGAQQLARNPVYHARTKHIDIKWHFIRSICSDGLVEVVHTPTQENVADILTKGLPRSDCCLPPTPVYFLEDSRRFYELLLLLSLNVLQLLCLGQWKFSERYSTASFDFAEFGNVKGQESGCLESLVLEGWASEEKVVYGLVFILAVGANWVFFRYRCKVCLNVAMAGQDCCGGRSMLDVSKHLEE
ncbi:hypothetical protein LAZ67_5003884 [Cordylochernes scorpioides]|uniref:Gag-pol polyprotein n=1 Tax=Cordylochernes scorpioides TaxID=51811 RepID=A0ABY6KME0_9ARAC|nr:hypothetical protein LAZ67_5003884 [Cordylochernes scorpioides]